MLTFYITLKDRYRAQARAAELDVYRTNPTGQYPFVWDNRLGCVNRWYDFASSEDKIGTIYFEHLVEGGGGASKMVKCTTDVTHHPLEPDRRPRHVKITDPEEHKQLVEFFYRELLRETPKDKEPPWSENG